MKLELIKNIQPEAPVVEGAGEGDMGQWINSKEAAEILGVNQSRVRQFVADGRLKSHTPEPGQRDHYFKRADVEALAKKPRERTGRPPEGESAGDKGDKKD